MVGDGEPENEEPRSDASEAQDGASEIASAGNEPNSGRQRAQ